MNTNEHRMGPSSSKANPGHGGGVRGSDLPRRSRQFEGTFGRMFRSLPPALFKEEDLRKLAAPGGMTAEPEAERDDEGKIKRNAEGFILCEATLENEIDGEENFAIPAGYTYLGQFIDHDLTFDPASSLQRQNDPDALVDFRTPRFDLDCIYGRGPDDQPYMYDETGRLFLLGDELTANGTRVGTRDLPRFSGRALIGDKRNDENVIVSQLQGVFLRFHNAVANAHPEESFSQVQKRVRWHYQWVVLHDFLRRIVGEETLYAVLPHLKSGRSIHDDKPRLDFYDWRDDPFIPIEFAMAAYRFGHSMVRPIYRLSTELDEGSEQDLEHGRKGRFFIFAGAGRESLAGFGPFPNTWAIDWRLYFEIDDVLSPENTLTKGKRRIQPSYKIDTSLVNPLGFLPEFSKRAKEPPRTLVPDSEGNPTPVSENEISNLALRNLLRGLRMDLPSGQDVARLMSLEPLADDQIRIGKAQWEDAKDGDKGGIPITEFGDSFRGQAPLWTYVLAEARHDWLVRALALENPERDADTLPVHLGPVGGRIVAEVFVGLLLGDSHSFLAQSPAWSPEFYGAKGRFEMPDLIAVALSGGAQGSEDAAS